VVMKSHWLETGTIRWVVIGHKYESCVGIDLDH
jgi:hypothetical protein